MKKITEYARRRREQGSMTRGQRKRAQRRAEIIDFIKTLLGFLLLLLALYIFAGAGYLWTVGQW